MSRKKTNSNEAGVSSETKNEKFKRVVVPRVNKSLDSLRLVKNVFASKSYDMSEDEAQSVVSVLQSALDEIVTAFESRSKRKEDVKGFSF